MEEKTLREQAAEDARENANLEARRGDELGAGPAVADPRSAAAATESEVRARAVRPGAPPAASRLVSLDVFRGMTIAAMLLVNDPGTWSAIYPPLEHAEWNGWTHTDLIFPFFLFIAGVAMVISFDRRRARGATRRDLLLHTLRRGAAIFAIGLMLHAYPFFPLSHIARLRYLGVLQRIGLTYMIAGGITLYSGLRGRIVALVGLLVGYWLLMTFVPVPGYGAGHLDPIGNVAAYVDRSIMLGHLWKPLWDPEGFLSTMGAIATALLGVLTGSWLTSARPAKEKLWGMIAAGAAGMAFGEVLNLGFPINKSLWTSSYVVFTAGYALLVLAACYWVIDMKGWKRWATPFLVFGMNSIATYALSGFAAKNMYLWTWRGGAGKVWSVQGWIYQHWFAPFAQPINASLAYAVCFVLFWLAVMWVFYRKRVFLKV